MTITYFILQHDLKARAGEVLAIDSENNTMSVFSQRVVADVQTSSTPQMMQTPQAQQPSHNTPTNWEQFLDLMRQGLSIRDASNKMGIPVGTLGGWRARAVREKLIPPGRNRWKKKQQWFRSEETLKAAQERGARLASTMKARRESGRE